ncbi:MAG: hypothetical protein AAF927_19835 [Bacteroidota bacterium]
MKSALLLILGFWASTPLWAQLDNGTLYRQLWEAHFRSTPAYAKVSGQILETYFPPFATDSSASKRLQVLKPEVSYEQIADKRITRRLEIPYNVKDSLIESFRLSHMDTLDLLTFKQIHRQSKDDLRGESPTFGARWLKPGLMLGLSVGGIIALFYVRSR